LTTVSSKTGFGKIVKMNSVPNHSHRSISIDSQPENSKPKVLTQTTGTWQEGTVSWQALEAMPLDILQQKLEQLEGSFQEAASFVGVQEEEVLQQLQLIDNLREQLKTSTESERSTLLNELVEEQDRYRFLEETLVGQRRKLNQLEDTLTQHQQVFWQRQREAVLKVNPQRSVTSSLNIRDLM